MAKLLYKNGITSVILRIKFRDSTTGAGKTTLTFSSSGLIISTIADNEASATVYTASGSTIETITTLGTFAAPTATKCRFKEVDATNHPGVYEVQIADARWAVSNARSIIVTAQCTGAIDVDAEVQLSVADLTTIANVPCTVTTNNDKTGYSLTQSFPTNFSSLFIDSSGRVDIGYFLGTASAGHAGYAGIDWSHIFGTSTLQLLQNTIISTAGLVETSTATAGSSNTITMDTPLGAGANNIINGCKIKLTGGTGIYQCRTIIGYNDSTGVITVDRNWLVNPDNTTKYVIYFDDAPFVDITGGVLLTPSQPGITFATLTVTGAFLVSGGTTFTNGGGDGFTCSSTNAGSVGAHFIGSNSSFGYGFRIEGGGGNAPALFVTGAGAGEGIRAEGGSGGGTALHLLGGSSNGYGFYAIGGTNQYGGRFEGGSSAGGGCIFYSPNSGHGIWTLSSGDGNGILAVGTASGYDINGNFLNSGLAGGGSSTTITLDSGSAVATNDYYKGATVFIAHGTGAGQAQTITGYVGSTKVASVAGWATAPDNTSRYVVLPDLAGSSGGGSAPTVSQIATGVWEDLLAGGDFGTAGSIGKLLSDNINATISSRMATFTLPTNFSSLAITVGGAVTVGTNNDKTGYSLTQAFPSNFASLSIDSSGRVLLQPSQPGVTFATLTVSGTTTYSGLVTMSDSLIIQTGGDGFPALTLSGVGAKALAATANVTRAVDISCTATNGDALALRGHGTGGDLSISGTGKILSPITGFIALPSVAITSIAASNFDALKLTGDGTGHDLNLAGDHSIQGYIAGVASPTFVGNGVQVGSVTLAASQPGITFATWTVTGASNFGPITIDGGTSTALAITNNGTGNHPTIQFNQDGTAKVLYLSGGTGTNPVVDIDSLGTGPDIRLHTNGLSTTSLTVTGALTVSGGAVITNTGNNAALDIHADAAGHGTAVSIVGGSDVTGGIGLVINSHGGKDAIQVNALGTGRAAYFGASGSLPVIEVDGTFGSGHGVLLASGSGFHHALSLDATAGFGNGINAAGGFNGIVGVGGTGGSGMQLLGNPSGGGFDLDLASGTIGSSTTNNNHNIVMPGLSIAAAAGSGATGLSISGDDTGSGLIISGPTLFNGEVDIIANNPNQALAIVNFGSGNGVKIQGAGGITVIGNAGDAIQVSSTGGNALTLNGDFSTGLGLSIVGSGGATIQAINDHALTIQTVASGKHDINLAGDHSIQGYIAGVASPTFVGLGAEVQTELSSAMTELTSVPGVTGTLKQAIEWLFLLARNKRLTTATLDTLRNAADSANIATATLSDDGTTGTRGAYQ